jgi:hypothetical protein
MCINVSLMEGHFPSKLKVSKVIPIYKKGDRDSSSSFRPISLVPTFGKVYEAIIKTQITTFFDQHNLLSRNQFGFRHGMSTIDAVRELVSSVLDNFELGLSTGSLLCDLSKAFDCVDHGILLYKLESYGIIGNANSLFRSYLSNRQQKVFSNSLSSNLTEVKYGVPQGSVLGPFLFLILINDLDMHVKCNSILFADDVTFYFASHSIDYINLKFNSIIDEANEWYRANYLFMNVDKTQSMIFSLNSNLVRPSHSVKLLGIYLDQKLSWHVHVESVCKRLSRIVYLLKHLKNYISKDYLKSVYFGLFQSVLTYGLILWGNSSSINNFLLLQKKAIRILTNSGFRDHCKPLFIQEHVLTVINLYIFHCMLHVKKHISSYTLNLHVHSYNTRTRNAINRPFTRLSKVLDSYEHVGVKLFNRLPARAQDVSYKHFKHVLYDWLANRPFYNIDEFFSCDMSTLNF